jgi:septal ring factor EnvC (AmiA/AmiB activator)
VLPPAILAQPAADYEKSLKQQQEELKKLKKDIASKNKAKDQLVSKEKNIMTSLQKLEQQRDLTSRQIAQLTREEAALSGDIADKNVALGDRQSELGVLHHAFAARVREIYKRRVVPGLEWLLATDSFTQAQRNLVYLDRAATQDQDEYRSIVRRITYLRRDKETLESTLAHKLRIKQEKEVLSAQLQKERTERADLLNKVRGQKSTYEAYIRDKEQEYQAIQKMIDVLEKERLAASKKKAPEYSTLFAQSQGGMVWPVSGTVVTRFGRAVHPQFNTVTFNKGVDIKAEIGSPVRAVWSGKVTIVDWIRGYGKLVVLDHGDGFYTLYAHLADVLVEKKRIVTKGDVIGTSGDTGSIKGPVLHFELRKGKDVLDPLDWLK